jgi:hypothetical protein
MRVWTRTPPHLLNRKHLLGEHQEVHVLINGFGSDRGYSRHAEARNFASFGRKGLEALVVRHEMIRVAMDHRWSGRHDSYTHPTPVDSTLMDVVESWLVREYEEMLSASTCDSWIEWFDDAMESIDFPRSALADDRPWDRDRMTMDWYLSLGNDWTSEYKEGDRPVDSMIGWTRRPTDRALDCLTAKGIVYAKEELRVSELA